MNKHVILLSAAAVLLFSCSREVDQAIQPGETITFTAAWAGADETRTILQSDGTSVWWDAAEQINVFFSDKASGKFTSTNSQSQAIVDFQGSLPIVVGSVETENPPHAYWAVYPYNVANTCDGESVILTIPSTQTAVEGTFANKMFPSIATSTNFYLAFYNVCGGVRFTVANEGISSVTFKANNEESLVGKVQVGFDGAPMIQNVIEGNSEVVVNAPSGGFVPGKYYFAALLPQTLAKGVNLTFKKEDGKVASTSLDNSITINRSRFGKMEEKDKGLEFKDDGSGHNPSDNIVFADEKVKEKLVAAFDTNGDGEISYAEAAAVESGTELKNAFGSIKTYRTFDEFQFFTGLARIPESMFDSWNLLTSVSIPTSVIGIDDKAFYGCSKLTSLSIPENVTTIGKYVFYGCSGLTSLTIPDGVYRIGEYCFNNCSNLRSFIVPEEVTVLETFLFGNCNSLVSIILPSKLKTIRTRVFEGCSNLQSINIPESVSTIGERAFYGCSRIVSVTIPLGVKSIERELFYECRELISVFLPETVNSIGHFAFHKCSSLTSISIPESVSSIGTSAFYDCSSLQAISIPKSVTQIGSSAFQGCSSLTSISIPESVIAIGEWAFSSCSSVESITVEPQNPVFDSRDGSNAIIETETNELVFGCKNTIIPSSVTSIGKAAFAGCSSITSVNIPENIANVGVAAFSDCYNLTSILIPKKVSSIGGSAFENCTSLTSITVLPETPPTGGQGMFFNTNHAPIYVPSESILAYREAQYWKDYDQGDRFQAIPE